MKQDKQAQAQVGKFHFAHLGEQLSGASGGHSQVEHMDEGVCGDAEQPCCSLKCMYVNVHPSDSLLVLLFVPALMSWVRTSLFVCPVSIDWVMKLLQTLTERIPLLSLRGANILYEEQQLVSVRPMSEFWLRLRGRSGSTQLQVTKSWV